MTAAPSRATGHAHANGGEGTRGRILAVALRLFAERSIAGTSLQMIADDLGITKAAVYHHFHTREELLSTLVRPVLDEMRAAVDAAAALRTPRAQADGMLTGFVALAVRHRKLIAILGTDRAIAQLPEAQEQYAELVEHPLALLGGTAPAAAGRINATVTLAGIASAAASDLLADVDDDALRRHLMETGRRALGLRPPRPPSAT